MSRKNRLLGVLMASLLMVSSFNIASAVPATSENASRIHFDSIVVDTHNDTMMKVVNPQTWLPEVDLGGNTNFHIDIPKAQAGGLNVGFFSAYTGYQGSGDIRTARTNSRILALLNALHWNARNNPDTLEITTSVKEIEKTVGSGKIAAVPTIEGAYSLEEFNAIELLNQYYDIGVRAVALVWNPANALGAGTTGPIDMGLTKLGIEVVKEMNRLGMIVDVSHMNQTTFWDVIKYSKAPIIASHSSASGIRDHVRNLTDAQLLAIKENGGVAQMNFWNSVLGYPGETINIKKLADHIDYAVNLIGVDHVGIGSDFDGANMPVDLPDASYLPKLTEELIERGYSKQDIEKILGLNSMRVLKEVEKVAEKDSSRVGQGITIIPSLEMGDIIQDASPLLTAAVKIEKGNQIDKSSLRVIVDGIVYEAGYDDKTEVLYLQLEEPLLKSNFHVVTFEGKNRAGKITRETRIFYVQ